MADIAPQQTEAATPTQESVNIVDDNNQLVSLPAEQVQTAISKYNYRMPTEQDLTAYDEQQKYGEGAGPYKAAVAGAASGLTLGLSDLALTKTGAVNHETLEKLEQYNPTVYGAANIAGAIAPMLIPGGAEVKAAQIALKTAEATGDAVRIAEAAKVLEAANTTLTASSALLPTRGAAQIGAKVTQALAPESSATVAKILAGVGAKTAGSAVEATAYGLGQTVHEDALGDPDAISEHLLHNIGYSAIIGGGLGAGLGLGSATYSGVKGLLAKKVETAALKDSIIENAAHLDAPQSMAELAARNKEAIESGLNTELPQQSRALETNQILAEDSNFPMTGLQIASLENKATRQEYKTHLLIEEGRDHALWEANQKAEGTQLVDKFTDQISLNATGDATEGGLRLATGAKQQLSDIKDSLVPGLKELDAIKSQALQDPQQVVDRIMEAIPDAERYLSIRHANMEVTPGAPVKLVSDLIKLKPYTSSTTMPKESWVAVKHLVDALNKPDITLGDIRALRTRIAAEISPTAAPIAKQQTGALRKSLLDLIDTEAKKTLPASEVQKTMQAYAINEANREFLRKEIFKGSMDEIHALGKGISHEDIVKNIFKDSDTVRAAKQALSPKVFKQAVADHIANLKEVATDPTKGFNSNTFSRSITRQLPELKEALIDSPEQLNKIQAITDKMRMTLDSIPANSSNTAITKTLMEKMQKVGGYLSNPLRAVGDILQKRAGQAQKAEQEAFLNEVMAGRQKLSGTGQLAAKQQTYGTFAKIERMAQSAGNTIDRGAKAIFTGADVLKGTTAQHLIPADKFQKMSNKIKTSANDIEHFANTMTQATQQLHQMAPNITASLNAATARATQFLNSKLPAQEPSSPLTEPYQPSAQELATFNRYHEVVENPMMVLREAAKGTLTHEHMDALTTVYPKLYTQMQQAVMDSLVKNKEPLSYQKKLMLSMFTGNEMVNSLKPGNIAANQVMMNQQAQKSPPMQTPGALGKIDKSNQYLTETQRIMNKQKP